MILSNLIGCICRISVMLLLRISSSDGNLKWQPYIYIAPFILEVFTLYKVIWSNHFTYPPQKFCHLQGKYGLTLKTDSTVQIIMTRGKKPQPMKTEQGIKKDKIISKINFHSKVKIKQTKTPWGYLVTNNAQDYCELSSQPLESMSEITNLRLAFRSLM